MANLPSNSDFDYSPQMPFVKNDTYETKQRKVAWKNKSFCDWITQHLGEWLSYWHEYPDEKTARNFIAAIKNGKNPTMKLDWKLVKTRIEPVSVNKACGWTRTSECQVWMRLIA